MNHMNHRCATLAVVSIGLLMAGFVALSDSVETWDGLLFEGTILSGVPDVLTMDDNGVTVSIRHTAILEIAFVEGSESARVTTTTGRGFEDRVFTAIGTITIRTSSGDTEIPNTQLRKMTFPYTQSESPPYDTTAFLKDGRSYEGDLTAAFPDTISIESGGITSNVRTDRIITLEFGEPSRIETRERVYSGQIVSNLPEAIQLKTKYGELGIRRLDVSRLSLSPTFTEQGTTDAGGGGFAFGVGFEMLVDAPVLFLHLGFGNLAAELGAGFSGGVMTISAVGKIQLPIVAKTLSLYGRGGMFGAPGVAMGIQAFAGAEISLIGLMDVPLSFFAGPGLVYLNGFFIPGWQYGIQWEF